MLKFDNGFQGVIFDMDGTLVDSMWVWGDIDIHYLGSFGIKVPENLQVLLGGLSFRQTAYYFREHFGIKDPVEVIEETWNRMALDRYRDEVKLKKGAAAFLAYLRDKKIPVGIATSNSRELVEVLLGSLGLKDMFSAVVTGNEVVNGKPDPEVYLTCAGLMDTDPAGILVFEDVLNGITAAKRAGMKVCAVYDDHCSSVDQEKRELADYYINDFTEIIV